MIDAAAIRVRWEMFGAKLDERGRRLFAATEVRAAGRGGLALVSKITVLARSTINRGEDDLDEAPLAPGRVRREGGGRRMLADKHPGLREALLRLVEPSTLGDPMRPLLWVSKSLQKLAAALTSMGFPVGVDTVREELRRLGFSRQGNRKAFGRFEASRSRRSVRAHQCESDRRSAALSNRSFPSTRRKRN